MSRSKRIKKGRLCPCGVRITSKDRASHDMCFDERKEARVNAKVKAIREESP